MADGVTELCQPAGSIGYLLRRAHKLAVPLAENVFFGEELSFTQWIALVQLHAGLIDTGSALARSLDHDSGATTRMVDQLEARGLISRQRSATDRRVVHLSLTNTGRSAAEALMPRMAAFWQDVLTGFDPEEVTLLTRLLQRLVERLDAETVRRGLA